MFGQEGSELERKGLFPAGIRWRWGGLAKRFVVFLSRLLGFAGFVAQRLGAHEQQVDLGNPLGEIQQALVLLDALAHGRLLGIGYVFGLLLSLPVDDDVGARPVPLGLVPAAGAFGVRAD